jgi:predicted oxidoreductase
VVKTSTNGKEVSNASFNHRFYFGGRDYRRGAAQMKVTKKDILATAWSALQTTIAFVNTDGEYDVTSLIDRVARDTSHKFKSVSYTEVADYLEAKYAEDDQ